jgi:hypothetical protein
MKKDILNAIDETTDQLLTQIALFSQEKFNTVPFEGSWTAAQVAEHIYKSETGIPKIWQGNTVVTTRPVDEKVNILKSIFLDFSSKLKSPDFILPSGGTQQVETLYNAIQSNRAIIRHLIETIDLNLTFTDASFPQLGELTGIEWASFLIYHSKRHTLQLQNIFAIIK